MSCGLRPWALGLALCLPIACGRAPESKRSQPPAAAEAPAVTRAVTFNADIGPILFEHCATCHRPVDPAAVTKVSASSGNRADPICIAGAPFSLLDYESARDHARQIADATRRRAMPPWLPETGHGTFLNERRLSDEQIALIQSWVEQGAPEGDASAKPKAPSWPAGWQLGTPDLVVTLPEAYTLRPGERDVFRNFVIPLPSGSTRYVRAVEFRADNPRVLHHASVALDPDRVSRRLDRADAGPGFATMPEDDVQNVYGWSPGKMPILEPADTAWTLENGSDLVVQLHMVPGGQVERVRPAVGLFFAQAAPTRVPIVVKLESKTIDIPAGDAGYLVEDSYVLPADVDAVSVYPHAHYLAKEMRGTAIAA